MTNHQLNHSWTMHLPDSPAIHQPSLIHPWSHRGTCHVQHFCPGHFHGETQAFQLGAPQFHHAAVWRAAQRLERRGKNLRTRMGLDVSVIELLDVSDGKGCSYWIFVVGCGCYWMLVEIMDVSGWLWLLWLDISGDNKCYRWMSVEIIDGSG